MKEVDLGSEAKGTYKRGLFISAEEKTLLDKLVAGAVAAEREACAILVEGFKTEHNGTVSEWGEMLAAVIRERGQ